MGSLWRDNSLVRVEYCDSGYVYVTLIRLRHRYMYVVECQRLRDKYRLFFFFFFLTKKKKKKKKKNNLRACGVLLIYMIHFYRKTPIFHIYKHVFVL